MGPWKNLVGGMYSTLEAFLAILPVHWSPLKVLFYRVWGARIGSGSRIESGVRVIAPRHLKVGNEVWLDRNVTLICGPLLPKGRAIRWLGNSSAKSANVGQLQIGDRVHIGIEAIVQAHAGVDIGADCGLAPRVCVYSVSHHFRGTHHPRSLAEVGALTSQSPTDRQFLIAGRVKMAAGVGVGFHAIVLPGTVIGAGSWIAAQSVVRGYIAPATLSAGTPARFVKSIIEAS